MITTIAHCHHEGCNGHETETKRRTFSFTDCKGAHNVWALGRQEVKEYFAEGRLSRPKRDEGAIDWDTLHQIRESHRGVCERWGVPVHPTMGPWFTDADGCEEYPHRCGLCGSWGRLYDDHCHVTGLNRGLLCPSCNTMEGVKSGEALDAWRVSAPLLRQDLRSFYHSIVVTTDGYGVRTGLHLSELQQRPMLWLLTQVGTT